MNGESGRARARDRERREFRAWLLRLASEPHKQNTAATLALCLGHGDLLPRMTKEEAKP